MEISIEKAEAADIDALVKLLEVLFSIEQDFSPDATAQRDGLTLLLDNPDRAQVFIVRHPIAGVVGMVSAQLVISTAVGAPSAWIEDLVVQEQFRKQGVGKTLLEQAQEWATTKGAKRVQLIADADNTSALDFYNRLGWTQTRLQAWNRKVS